MYGMHMIAGQALTTLFLHGHSCGGATHLVRSGIQLSLVGSSAPEHGSMLAEQENARSAGSSGDLAAASKLTGMVCDQAV